MPYCIGDKIWLGTISGRVVYLTVYMTQYKHFPRTFWGNLGMLHDKNKIIRLNNWLCFQIGTSYIQGCGQLTNRLPQNTSCGVLGVLKNLDDHLATLYVGIFSWNNNKVLSSINQKRIPVSPHNTEFLQLDNQHQQTRHYEHQTNLSQILQNHTDEQIPEE